MHKLKEILYNPGSIQTPTCPSAMLEEGQEDSHRTLELAESDDRILANLEKLILAENESQIAMSLEVFLKDLQSPISKQLTGLLLGEINRFLERCLRVCPQSNVVFDRSVQLIVALKNKMDGVTSKQIKSSDWVELERSIYLLTTWEEQLEATGKHQIFH